jgi:hypothetical protein
MVCSNSNALGVLMASMILMSVSLIGKKHKVTAVWDRFKVSDN